MRVWNSASRSAICYGWLWWLVASTSAPCAEPRPHDAKAPKAAELEMIFWPLSNKFKDSAMSSGQKQIAGTEEFLSSGTAHFQDALPCMFMHTTSTTKGGTCFGTRCSMEPAVYLSNCPPIKT